MSIYKKNFLTNVIYKLDFNDINELNDEEYIRPLYEKVSSIFPITRLDRLNENAITINVLSKEHSFSNKPLLQLVCSSLDSKAVFVLTKSSLSIDIRNNYTDLQAFIKIIEVANSSIIDLKDSISIKRLAVRYINQIIIDEGKPFDNSKYVNSKLTRKECEFFSDKEQKMLIRSLSQTSMEDGDYRVNFINGYANSQFPARIMKNEYVLDIDCYTHTCEFDDITSTIEKMNREIITPLFEKSIENDLRKIMNQ